MFKRRRSQSSPASSGSLNMDAKPAPGAALAQPTAPRAATTDVEAFMRGLKKRNPDEHEFHQAVHEVAESVMPFVHDHPIYQQHQILERMAEPERIIQFRVIWEDRDGNVRVNRAWRVQFNGAIGPYKGGLRFHPSVTTSVLKFLGFEQTFKNALTGLPMGGGKGGANFNPRGKTDSEVMRFCQAMMSELYRHIDEDTDVPAGDIGVGAREVSYLFGMYRKLENKFVGVMTGKGLDFGGSLIRKEATGYGAVYFIDNMLAVRHEGVKGKTVAISGSGNVAIYAAEKVRQLGGKVVTLSDSSGTIYDPAGIDEGKLNIIKDIKEVRRDRISAYADEVPGATFYKDARPWGVECDIAIPCATQNELDLDDAKMLISNGVEAVGEGANMPTTLEAVHALLKAGVLFGPAKAVNAGGVGVSGLEQSQNALRLSWSAEEVEAKLKQIMDDIHKQCLEYGRKSDGSVNYVDGANIAGFKKVADAMVAQGYV
ncbi:MAG: NADP-specific glutamate dehydrogenase [Pseudomonadota bacterium]